MKHRCLIAVLLLTSLVLTLACREETAQEKKETWLGTPNPTDTAAGTTAGDTASATHPGSPGGTAVVPDVAAGTTVLVLIQEGSIAVQQQSIPPGPAVLTIENRGKELHNVFIEGAGISRAAGDPIAEGGSATVDVQFKPGTYTLYCPVADHRTKGEQIQVTIQ